MTRFIFAGQSLCAIQMVIPFTFDGVDYEADDWIVISPTGRGAYTDRAFQYEFSRAIAVQRIA